MPCVGWALGNGGHCLSDRYIIPWVEGVSYERLRFVLTGWAHTGTVWYGAIQYCERTVAAQAIRSGPEAKSTFYFK